MVKAKMQSSAMLGSMVHHKFGIRHPSRIKITVNLLNLQLVTKDIKSKNKHWHRWHLTQE
jgi:hypothetical protein